MKISNADDYFKQVKIILSRVIHALFWSAFAIFAISVGGPFSLENAVGGYLAGFIVGYWHSGERVGSYTLLIGLSVFTVFGILGSIGALDWFDTRMMSALLGYFAAVYSATIQATHSTNSD